MRIEKQLNFVETTFDKSMDLVAEGKFNAALKEIKSLDDLFVISEATRAQTLVKGYILLQKNKKRKAKEICIKSICYLWNNPDGLYLIRQAHAACDNESKLYNITIRGGCAALGLFTVFTEEHISDFDVIANDEFEAIRYIDEVANYLNGEQKTILESRLMDINTIEDVDRRGVYYTSPFRIE